jgi:hypothetical protein
MTPDEIIKLIKDDTANAAQIHGARIVHIPDEELPVGIVAKLRHIESGMKYNQVFRMRAIDAQALANALLVQSSLSDPPPAF